MPINAPKSRNGGKRLSDLQKEVIFQTYAISGNVYETARATGVAYNTAYNLLKKIPKADIAAARQEMAIEMAAKVHDKTVEILDSMHPADLETMRYQDDKGIWHEIGPSALQKATSIGILVDKQAILLQLERNLVPRDGSDHMIPTDMASLLQGIGARARTLRILGIEIDLGEPQINTLEVAMQEVTRAEAASAEGEGGFDFDGQG